VALSEGCLLLTLYGIMMLVTLCRLPASCFVVGHHLPEHMIGLRHCSELPKTSTPPAFVWQQFLQQAASKMPCLRSACFLHCCSLHQVTAADYLAAQPDPVAAFAPHVAGHMNGEDSHVQDMVSMVQHYVGIKVSSAKMLGLDRLGTDLQVNRDGQTFKIRLPFVK
jgi:hypothetical protein